MASDFGANIIFENLQEIHNIEQDIARHVAQEIVKRCRKRQLISGEDGVGLTYENLELLIESLMEEAVILSKKLSANKLYGSERSPGDEDEDPDLPSLSDDGNTLSSVNVSDINRNESAPLSPPEIEYLLETIKSMGFEVDDAVLLKLLKHHGYDEDAVLNAIFAFSEKGMDKLVEVMALLDTPEFTKPNIMTFERRKPKPKKAKKPVEQAEAQSSAPPMDDREEEEIEYSEITAPSQDDEPIDLEDLLNDVFSKCDWTKHDASDMVEPVMYALSELISDSKEIRTMCLTTHHSYPGCESGGTLFHALCDFPDHSPDENRYMQLVDILADFNDSTIDIDLPRSMDDHTPLFRAVVNGHVGMVRTLLNKTGRVDPNKVCNGKSLLEQALSYDGQNEDMRYRFGKIAALLINNGSSYESTDTFSPLLQAIKTENTEAVDALLDRGVDPNATIKDWTPLIFAVMHGSQASLGLLLNNYRIDLNSTSQSLDLDDKVVDSSTAVIEILRRIHKPYYFSMLKKFLNAKGKSVDLNLINSNGESCASMAAKMTDVMRRFEVMDLLLDHPIPCSFKNIDLNKTLTELVKHKVNGLKRLQKLLVIGQANPNEPNFQPLDLIINQVDESSVQALDTMISVGCEVNWSPRPEGPLRPKPPPLMSLVQLYLQEEEGKNLNKKKGVLSRVQRKVLKIANAPNINKDFTIPDVKNPGKEVSAIDLILGRYTPLLSQLEDRSSKLWKQYYSTKEPCSRTVSAAGDTVSSSSRSKTNFTLPTMMEAIKQIDLAVEDLEGLIPCAVESSPTKRMDLINDLKAAKDHISDIVTTRLIWKELHDTIIKYEINLGSSEKPLLAGQQWTDLKHELSYREDYLDDAQALDDEIGDVGLTKRDDFMEQLEPRQDLKKQELVAKGLGAAEAVNPVKLEAELEDKEWKPNAEATEWKPNLAAKEWTPFAASPKTPPVEQSLSIDEKPDEEADGEEILLLPTPPSDPNVVAQTIELEKESHVVDDDLKPIKEDNDDSILLKEKLETEVLGVDNEKKNKETEQIITEVEETKDVAEDDVDDGYLSEDGENETDDFILSVVPKNIGLSRYAYNWFQKSDSTLVEMALKKLILLAEGPIAWKRSRQLSKVLEGQRFTPTKFPIREAKLDRGMRILWQECSALNEGSGGESKFAVASGSILIWYITKHDFISARMMDIDRCFNRMNVTSGAFDAAFVGGAIGQHDMRHSSVPEVLLDPRGNTPLMVYDVMVHELPRLESRWSPPMKLTAKEEFIVKTDGLVTIIGRSGTGKTVCVAMRMDRDAKAAEFGNAMQRGLRQVFIARSRALCSQVRRMVETGGHNVAASTSLSVVSESSHTSPSFGAASSLSSQSVEEVDDIHPTAQFVTIDEFVRIVEDSIVYREDSAKRTWNLTAQVRWKEFEKDFWPSLSKYAQKGLGGRDEKANTKLKKGRGGSAAEEGDEPIVPLMVWTQIRSLIKGSVEAAWGLNKKVDAAADDEGDGDGSFKRVQLRSPGTPISRDEYMALHTTRCPLTPKQRSAAYEYFEMYENWLKQGDRWDDMDRVLELIKTLKSEERALMNSSIWKQCRVPFDRIYADEIQDATQAEITLFSLSCNDHIDGLFLAGDNAQAITHGVSFRFQELRLIMSYAAPSKATSIKPLTLTSNYRSHSGVLDFAASLLSQLDICFPKSFAKLQADCGLSKGPRPVLWTCKTKMTSLKNALKLDERLIVLTRDENKYALLEELRSDPELADRIVVLGVCEAKGLEFNEVILVDFFRTAPKHVKDGWTKLLNLDVIVDSIAVTHSSGHDKRSSKQLQEMAKDVVPLDLEVDLKQLYTAVTRCRNRLVLCETEPSSQWSKFVKLYHKEVKLACEHSLPESNDGDKTALAAERLMPDELIDLGLQFIQRFDIKDGEEEEHISSLTYAINYFKRAGEGAKDLLVRARVLEKHHLLWSTVKQMDASDWKGREEVCTRAAIEFLNVGLVCEAKEVCLLGSTEETVFTLTQRMEKLDTAWRIQAKEEAFKNAGDTY